MNGLRLTDRKNELGGWKDCQSDEATDGAIDRNQHSLTTAKKNLLCFFISGISASVASRAYNVGKQVFTTVKAEFQKKAENSAASLPWKLQTVSASVDLMVWTAALQDEQGMSRRPQYLRQSCH